MGWVTPQRRVQQTMDEARIRAFLNGQPSAPSALAPSTQTVALVDEHSDERSVGQYRLLLDPADGTPVLAAAPDGAVYVPDSVPAAAELVAWLERHGYRQMESTLVLRIGAVAHQPDTVWSFRLWGSPRYRAAAGSLPGQELWK